MEVQNTVAFSGIPSDLARHGVSNVSVKKRSAGLREETAVAKPDTGPRMSAERRERGRERGLGDTCDRKTGQKDHAGRRLITGKAQENRISGPQSVSTYLACTG